MSEEEYDYKYQTAFERMGLRVGKRVKNATEPTAPNSTVTAPTVVEEAKPVDTHVSTPAQTDTLTTDFITIKGKQYDPLTCEEGVIINGVKWATRNVDKPGTFATKPEDAGMFYQWNRKIGWSATDPIVNSNGVPTWDGSSSSGATWESANDPSPAGWRVPTLDEIQKLLDINKVSSEWTTENGIIAGRKFTDRASGNSLFLPAAGGRHGSNGMVYGACDYGLYWSSTVYEAGYSYGLYFGYINAVTDWWNHRRDFGLRVRPVAK